jgi:hypothetical protein
MTKDDQRMRETVQAELRRRRSALDRSEAEDPDRPGTANGHAARAQGEDRRLSLRRPWSLPSTSASG